MFYTPIYEHTHYAVSPFYRNAYAFHVLLRFLLHIPVRIRRCVRPVQLPEQRELLRESGDQQCVGVPLLPRKRQRIRRRTAEIDPRRRHDVVFESPSAHEHQRNGRNERAIRTIEVAGQVGSSVYEHGRRETGDGMERRTTKRSEKRS